ncbi:cellulase family glycosylhydrolase [Sphingomonas daechungensis]|uniref:Glycoside hydrolase family 5 protein n=1 Tax=Sphingomonas daechungensis TaxID=1176646 RepID=A0ABX6T5G0_9SPHN|nr:glycoside hydrolase family 5 protein [Sphingomonas daechungensis]QNP44265.1 glycoside hydrolase family 5 protein [Sphingomonas daechungensis]
MLRTLIAAVAASLLALVSQAHAQSAPAPELKRGVNVLGYDPIWTDPAQGRFQERHFTEIRKGGFDFIRVNLAAFRHMDSSNTLSPRFLDRLDWIVNKAGAAGLSVILDEHDFNACSEDVDTCRTRLSAFWSQIAPRYRNAPPSVIFELLNEPHAKLDADTWNALYPEILAVVRKSNPTRTVIIGPTQWNSREKLDTLKLPANDPNIIVTFHYYDPFRFTHQGAGWVPEMKDVRGVTWGSDADRATIAADFGKVAAWAKANNRQILLGEFGAYDRSGTPIELRAAYTDAVAREAERHGFSWAYWQFDSDFIAWDMKRDGWVEPIHKALIPTAP